MHYTHKSASPLSQKELASLLPTKEEAGESALGRAFGHLLQGPTTGRRYGAARTIADATGQETPFLTKHPMTGSILSTLAGATIGGAIGRGPGATLGATLSALGTANSRASTVDKIREAAKNRNVDRLSDPNKSMPGWLQLLTGDYSTGVADAHTVFRGGENKHVTGSDKLARALTALSLVAVPGASSGYQIARKADAHSRVGL